MPEYQSQQGPNYQDPYPDPEVAPPELAGEPIVQPKPKTGRSFLGGVTGTNGGRWGIIFVIAGVGIVLVCMLVGLMPKKKVEKDNQAQQPQKQTVPQQSNGGLPTDRAAAPQQGLNASPDDITPDKIQRSTQLAPKQTNIQTSAGNQSQGRPETSASARSLGQVQPFTPPPVPGNGSQQWAPAPYTESAMSQASGTGPREVESSRRSALTRASMTFVDDDAQTHAAQGATRSEAPENENLGYRAGYHLSTHLETVASSFVSGSPVIAVVDFDYQRNGITIVPAGSRVIGTMGGANATGLVRINFSSIRLPNGNDLPVTAIGLDHQLMPLKGNVTGHHRMEQFLLATLAGTGNMASVFAGGNVNGSLSEADLLKMQASSNFGSAVDAQIGDIQSEVQQNLVVTLPAGTQVEVLFTNQNEHTTATKTTTGAAGH